jgi:putative transposase
MEQQTVRKTFKYKLKPSIEQERLLDRALMLCRQVYNAAITERAEAWQKRGVSVTYYQQKAELPDIKSDLPAYSEAHSQVLQNVIQRVDWAFQAFFRRVKAGETPGYHRIHGRNRYHSLTYPRFGRGVSLKSGLLNLSKIGPIAVRWSRPMEGTPKTVTVLRDADGWCVCISCAEAPTHPLPPAGQDTGIDLGLEAFATPSNGTRIFHPGWYRKAERTLKTAQRRVSRRKKGSNRRRKAVTLLARAHLKVKRQRADFHHRVALRLVKSHNTVYYEDLLVGE